jgi:hypothetical protein
MPAARMPAAPMPTARMPAARMLVHLAPFCKEGGPDIKRGPAGHDAGRPIKRRPRAPHPLINLVLWPKSVSLEYNSAVGLGGGSYYSQGTPCATGPRLAGSCKLYSRGLGVSTGIPRQELGGAAVAPPPLSGSVSGS